MVYINSQIHLLVYERVFINTKVGGGIKMVGSYLVKVYSNCYCQLMLQSTYVFGYAVGVISYGSILVASKCSMQLLRYAITSVQPA